MPEISFKSVSSCSSEDQRNPAENLLKDGGSFKWKSATAGEKRVSVVLQLSQASQIHSIDIGNEGSAFVEVLVGKEFDTNFEVLLVASSFMTPLESRNGTNRNGVRMFGPDKLNKTVADKKWDRVKVVCTQPFCKTSQYGLSFFKLHSPPTGKESQAKVHKLGHFTLKDDDEDSDIPVGSLFANRSKEESTLQTTVPSGAAAIRAAARQAELSQASTSSPKEESRKRSAISPPKASPGPKAARRDVSDSDEDEAVPVSKPALKKQATGVTSTTSSASSTTKAEKSALKRNKTAPASESPAKTLSKLMEDVTFVLSGFQNPFRGELRDKACEMGATYRSDWGKGCTHLICAFANTPKYKQVAGKGKIVTKGWILDSHKQKKLFPWRRYRLGDADSPSEEEEVEVMSSAKKNKAAPVSSTKTPTKTQQAKPEGPRKAVAFDDDSDSGGDTEDELLKARALSEKKKAAPQNDEKPEDPYGDSTDEDEPGPSTSKPGASSEGGGDGSDSGFPDLPDFFTDKYFFLYGEFPSAEQRLLTRYIYAYNGEVEDYMSKRVKYVVTAQKWDDNFDEALNENPDLVFVKPKWIYTCHEKLKLVPYQPHIVV